MHKKKIKKKKRSRRTRDVAKNLCIAVDAKAKAMNADVGRQAGHGARQRAERRRVAAVGEQKDARDRVAVGAAPLEHANAGGQSERDYEAASGSVCRENSKRAQTHCWFRPSASSSRFREPYCRRRSWSCA